MRELNPRVWIPSLNRYATGYDDLYYHRQMNTKGEWWFYPAGEDEQLSEIELELPTGLKDKNGKEIYEGDIIENTYEDVGKVRYEVRWECGRFIMESRKPYNYVGIGMGIYPHSSEVIGNIHENKELLEEE